MSEDVTKLTNLIDPEVIGDMAQAKIEAKISIIPYAKMDRTLVGNAGSTITVARYVWDGEAEEVAEGDDIPIRALGTESAEYPIKMAGIGTSITDKAVLSGYGNPVGACTQGIANSITAKLDEDAHAELLKTSVVYNPNAEISYENVVDAIGLFRAEGAIDMVALVDPDLVTTLRKDSNFIDKNKYGGNVMMNGEIGMIGNARIVPSRRASGVGGYFYTPIILTSDPEHLDDIPALTYFIKRDTNVEVERKSRSRTTEITVDQFYVVALTNESKVVVLKNTGANIQCRKMQEKTYACPGVDLNLATTPVTGTTTTVHNSATNWAVNLKLRGIANEMSATEKAALSMAEGTTHYITGCLEIPGVNITEGAPTGVTWNDRAVTSKEMRKHGVAWYIDYVFGLKQGADGVVLASGDTSFTIVANGVTTVVTPDFSGVTLA